MVFIVIAVVVAIAMMATLARFFQFMSFLLGLAAAFAVLADGFLQVRLGFSDLLFAFSIVPIMVAVVV